jgi:O-antigen biosynthesis protein
VILSDPPDMAQVYKSARVMVAPTRFSAGIPMKVHEAASQGVPVVMTDLLARQLGWQRDGIAATPSDPAVMARAIEAVALDAERWQRTQVLQLSLVAQDCDPAAFDAAIRQIVLGAGTRRSADVLSLERRRQAKRLAAAKEQS